MPLLRDVSCSGAPPVAAAIAGAALTALLLATGPASGQTDGDLVARARAIHQRVVTLDTHNDIEPAHFTAACNYTMRLTTQVNLPKMREGGLDVSFLIVYVGQPDPQRVKDAFEPSGYERAYRQAVEKFDAIHRLTKEIAPADIELASTSADVMRIAAAGRKVAVVGIENGYPIGTDLNRVREFWQRGGRYLSLAHNGHSQLADSNTGETANQWAFGGLSPLGRQVIQEMNRWGIMVDVSHLSKGAAMQAIAVSRAPVIASHSAVRALANHRRYMDDELLTAMKTNGGVVQIVAFSSYLRTPPPAAAGRGAAPAAPPPAPAAAAPPCPIENPPAAPPPPRPGRASVRDLVNHIDYAVKLMGIDHVGISSDFDGGGGIDGWNSASETFNVTLELVRRGYTEEQIAKIWSGNLLRVWAAAERVARDTPSAAR
jgi:membrane dipeptidase